MTVVIGLLHGTTFLSNLPLVLFVSFIGPWHLERTPIKPHLRLRLKQGRILYCACWSGETRQLKDLLVTCSALHESKNKDSSGS